MIEFKQKGDFKYSLGFLHRAQRREFFNVLDQYGKAGVEALSSATPRDTGKTANSWTYEVNRTRNSVSISWHNTNIADYTPVVVLIQYGHATPSGVYVEGVDFVNPAIKPVFNDIADAIWKEVTKK